jgi:hypothetical protein
MVETKAGAAGAGDAPAPAAAAPDDKDYVWYEMGFFSSWRDGGRSCRITCIDTPPELRRGLEAALRTPSAAPVDFRDPFALHAPLIDQIILQYDMSVWRVRHPVRKIEKVGGFLFLFFFYAVCGCVLSGAGKRSLNATIISNISTTTTTTTTTITTNNITIIITIRWALN